MSNNDYVVGRAYGEMAPSQSSVYEALLERAQRENEEQARLLGKGSEREARLTTERDYYKTSMETLLKSINDWTDSMVKEPADDFIAAIEAYIESKLNQ